MKVIIDNKEFEVTEKVASKVFKLIQHAEPKKTEEQLPGQLTMTDVA